MIKIYTYSHKRPDFLELQLKSFQRNLKDEFQFIVFNNATFDKNKSNYNEIHDFCRKNNLTCTDILHDKELVAKVKSYNGENVFNYEGIYFNAPIACAYPLCWSWKHYLHKETGKICIIDSDMFLVNPDSMSEALDTADLIYLEQSRGTNNDVYYMWNGLSLMNLDKMPNKEELNWWCGFCEGFPVDVGGQTFYYLKKYKSQLKVRSLNQYYTHDDPSCDFHPANYEHFAFNGENRSILHHRSGSLWDPKPQDYYNKKTEWLKHQLEK